MCKLLGRIISPAVGSISPEMILSWVDFPAPLTPTKPMRSPGLTSQLISLRTSPVG